MSRTPVKTPAKTEAPARTANAAAQPAPARGTRKRVRDDSGWQAQKSAMTRDGILDAAVSCFVEIGYAATTTARIAEVAGVSRGAMLHHFASKAELVQAAVEHLHRKLVALYATSIDAITHDLAVAERNRRGLQGYWNYLSSDLFIAYHELCVAGRSDPELQRILETTVVRFDEAVRSANVALFPEWAAKGELFDFAMDITKFVMEGMAVSQITGQKEKRIERMIGYLGDRLDEIFHEGVSGTAIQRHTTRKSAGTRKSR
jgi:AcrR family transcriptional regulator